MNTPFHMILMAGGFLALSGIPGLFLSWRSSFGQIMTTILSVSGAILGLIGSGWALVDGPGKGIALGWPIPGSELGLNVDALSAFFLIPVSLMAGLGSIYGLSYWKQSRHPRNGQRLRFFYGLLPASIILIVLAQNSIHFLIGWEVMALSTFFLIVTEDEKPVVREAGWIYLIATRLGTLCLFALFALLRKTTGSFALRPLEEGEIGLGLMTVIFLLAILGFGLKAGVMPLHVWLPGAHGTAPSHVSAFLSGALIKIGIYGMIRIFSFLPHPPAWWGGLLLALGVMSGVMGIIFALGQHDLKRLLAYSSIENIGIIVMGLGLALLGRSLDRVDWVVLGLGGALLHVWNHSLFKSLMFLGSGAIIHATHTRLIDRLGGLVRLMPRTFILFAIGSGAICALPPLNGFASEFLIYAGLFHTVGIGQGASSLAAAFAIPALAMIGALSAMCFLKLLGTVFLGQARSGRTTQPHDPDIRMTAPMIFLASCCWIVGLVPWSVVPFIDRAVADWLPASMKDTEALGVIMPLGWVTTMGFVLIIMAALGMVAVRMLYGQRTVVSAGTWDCGYARPTVRMQYTGSSFSQMLMELFSWAVLPKVHMPQVAGLFPRPEQFKSYIPDLALDRFVLPGFALATRLLAWLRSALTGRIQADLLYIFLIVIFLYFWR